MFLLSKFRSDSLLRHNAVFFLGSLFVAGLNYAYHPILSRMLGVEQFGEVTVIFSLTAQIGVLLSVFTMIATHLTSNHEHREGRNVLEDVYAIVFLFQIFALLLLVDFSGQLSTTLQFTSSLPFVFLALMTYIALPYSLMTASLQGEKQFTKLTFGALIQATGKLSLSALFVFFGLGVLGAMGGLIAAQLLALYYFTRKGNRRLRMFPRVLPTFDSALVRELRYGVLVFIATTTVALLYTFDTVVVKYFFSPEIAGQYSGVSIIARILFFATASISAVLLPSVTLSQSSKTNMRILGKSAILVMLIGGAGLIIMTLIPAQVIGALLGEKYLPLAPLLPAVALVMFLASLINLLTFYFLALRRYCLIPIGLCGIIALTTLVYTAHDEIALIIRHFILVEVCICILLALCLFYDYHANNKKTPLDNHPVV
jgi:O-antigen/teichoic acid export membrane protein